MAKIIEKRYIRIEDWNGNIYYPQSSAGDTTAGEIIDASAASTDPSSGSTTYTDGVQTSDPNANKGTAIILTAGDTNLNLFTTEIDSLPFGNIGIAMRVKSSIGSGSTVLMRVNLYYRDNTADTIEDVLLSTHDITGAMIGVANTFVDVGLKAEYKGTYTSSTSLKIQILLMNGTGAVMVFDHIAAAKAIPGLSV